MHKNILFTICFFLFSNLLFAAETQSPEMANSLRSDGKIYVVVIVLATIFAGIIAFLIHLERKISKLEKTSHNNL